jgi:drug/metabolite transporter (DMT)-like permease
MIVVYGLLAALGWGVADLLARFAGRSIGAYRAVFFAQATGLVVMTAWLSLYPANVEAAAARAGGAAWLAGLVAAPIVLIASYSLYRALAVGMLGIVSPVITSYGAITAALAAASGEALGGWTLLGIALSVSGVALASTPGRRKAGGLTGVADPVSGVGWALLAACGYGIGSWVQGTFAVPELGSFVPLWLYYAMGVVALSAGAAQTGASLRLPPLTHWWSVFGAGICAMGAYTSFSIGLASGRVAEVTVLSTLASGVSALHD